MGLRGFLFWKVFLVQGVDACNTKEVKYEFSPDVINEQALNL